MSATYTPTGKISTTTDANGNGITRYAYDANDRLASTTDPIGRQTTYAYDALNRQIAISNLAVQSTPLLQQAYTPDGLLASLTDANNHATSLAYDGFDRLATTTYPLGSTETLTYDADSNALTRKTRANQTISFAYDTLNRLMTKTPPAPAAVVSYRYDLNNRLIGVSDTSAAIAAAVPPSGPSVQYATTATAYDALNHPTGFSWMPAATTAAPTASSVTFGHAYNKANQRIGQTATDNSWFNYPAATPSTVSYTADALNRYTAVGAVSPTYDGNSNLTSDGTFTLGYDAENRLTSATGAGNTASYTYDAQGRRKTKTVNGTTTVFVTDAANREVLEYDGTSGAIQRWYAYGLGSNDVLNQTNVVAGTRAALVPDTLGSVIASLDSGSGTLSKIGYLPYGKSATAPGPFGYTGQRIDAETSGLYYYRARHYSPAWGRFLQTDPIGYGGGVNLYAYVGNDPLNLIDPFGFTADSPLGANPPSTSQSASSFATPDTSAATGSSDVGPGSGQSAAGDFAPAMLPSGSPSNGLPIQLAAADRLGPPSGKPPLEGIGSGGGFSRGGPTQSTIGGAPALGDVLAPQGNPVGIVRGGATSNIRTVGPAEFQTIQSDLLKGAQPIAPPAGYPGATYLRPDGTIFGIRSSASGPTIDVLQSQFPTVPNGFKVHQE